jgi:hypothetical protein
MARENFILYNVLNQEVIFEEYFCNLLSQESFLRKFLDFIATKNDILKNEDIKYKSFNTEQVLQIKNESYGRADIFLDLGDKKIIFEVKNKVYTSLTENQPQNYLKYLKSTVKNVNQDKDYNSYLMFLIPKNYDHINEIHQKWKNYSGVDKQLFYWEDFVKTLKDDTDVYVKAFYDFCVYWFDLDKIHFEKDELALLNFEGNNMELIKNETLPSLMSKLELMVIRIGESLKWEQFTVDKGGYTSGFNYTKKVKSYNLFLGIDYAMWQQYNQPINIYISNAKDTSKSFDLPLMDSIEFITYEFLENSNFDDFFGFVVKLDFTIEDAEYEEKMKNILKIIIGALN